MLAKRWTRLPLAAACGLIAVAAFAPGAQAQSTYPDPLYPAAYDQQCEKTATLVQGRGASFQRTLQNIWGAEIVAPDPLAQIAKGIGYDTGGCGVYKLASDGGTRKIQYSPAGSGAGRAAFGATDTPGAARDLSIDYGGTDDPPTATQIANANEGPNVVAGPDSDDGILHTIPIAQGADAVAVRVPDNCQIANTSARQLSRTKLEGFYRGLTAFDTYGELFGFTNVTATGGGLTNQQCQAKHPARVVRFDNSGTTFIFKQYLQSAAAGAFDWREPSQGGTLANNAWPAPTVNAGVNGNGALLDTLSAQATNGGIGYSDLATARGRNYGWDHTGSAFVPDDRTFWIRVQRIADNSYISPARSDIQTGSKGTRCSGVTYSGQPADTTHSWINANAVETATDYPICGLTYALAWQSDAAVGISSTGRAVARRDYTGYMLDRAGMGTNPPTSQCVSGDTRYGKAQCKLAGNDYARLPADVFTKSRAGNLQLGP
jgi:ABC-type phosphate transport system substrate-binding protein